MKSSRLVEIDRIEFEIRTTLTGAKAGATFVVDPGWWDSVPKLKMSPSGQLAFDLVLTDGVQGYPAVKEGLFQKLDLSRIANTANLSPSVLDYYAHDAYFKDWDNVVTTWDQEVLRKSS